MKQYELAVLPGDGIGQDVTLAAAPIFAAMQLPFKLNFSEIGWECWKKAANPIPEKTWQVIHASDFVLLGATTSMPEKEAIAALPASLKQTAPSYVSPIVQLRQQLDLFANIRPCFNINKADRPFNLTVIRENTEGLYAGFDFYPLSEKLLSIIHENPRWTELTANDASCSLRLQSRKGLLRLFEYAFNYADKHKIDRVTLADKPNVLRKSSVFAREVFENVANQFPHIKADIHNVDAVALWLVKRPQEFGVIVAENMFGDILSDLGAGVMGGLGFAASANIGAKGCYFEPVHGSAPRIQSHRANPSAMFLTISLLLEYAGLNADASIIKKSVLEIVNEANTVTYDLGGNATTEDMANVIIERAVKYKHAI